MPNPNQEFIRVSRRYLCEEFPAKLRLALEHLPDADLWWRPNAASNSVGNLILHLAGNVRQWVVSGLGSRPDVRRRAAEFSTEGGLSADAVMMILDEALLEVGHVLDRMDPDSLMNDFEIQGMSVGGMEALMHVVEHFSMHTGQIFWIIKARAGGDLGFYEVDEGGSVTGTRW